MSTFVTSPIMRGARGMLVRAGEEINDAILKYGPDRSVAFNNSAYFLPTIYGLTGLKIEKLEDMPAALERAKSLLPAALSDPLWQPNNEDAPNAGMATLLAEELIEGVRAATGDWPEKAPWGMYSGSIDDVKLRSWGIQLMDGRMPGIAIIIGTAKSTEVAGKIVRELQSRGILVFLSGASEERDGKKGAADQLMESGVSKPGLDTPAVALGSDTTSTVHALGFATRAALVFGGVEAGQAEAIQLFTRRRIAAFILALGDIDDLKLATLTGALSFGFPTISDTRTDNILPNVPYLGGSLVSVPFDEIPGENDLERAEKLVQRCIEIAGLKIKVTKIPIPVAYGSTFEGERVRRNRLRVEFGGKRATCFEYLRMRGPEDVEDGKITVVGDEVDVASVGAAMNLGIVVDVAGRKMETDFEPVIEHLIHHFINAAEGVQHIGHRDMVWVRLSKSSAEKGFRIRHLGEIIRARMLGEFSAIVDKVQVTLYTDPGSVEENLTVARQAYQLRDARMAGITDESVDTFYSCTLCQSFAPSHVCVVAPERLSLCGAYTWLDCKASHEINPGGSNKPIAKGREIDPARGIWEGPNEFVYNNSGRAIDTVSLYSIMEYPMTSCGCFECIAMVVPEANGVMVISREDTGMTPAGMTFSTLAGMASGGVQTPGIMGIGKHYLASKKFLAAEGGFKRVVWISSILKETMSKELRATAEREGVPDLLDRIADGARVTTVDELLVWIEQKDHPVLSMVPLF